MVDALIDQLKQLLEKDKDPTGLEQEFSKNHEYFLKVSCFLSLILGSASRICKFVPIMKAETANAIISEFNKEIAQESVLLLPSLECGRIGLEAAEVIAHFLVYPHLFYALPDIKPYFSVTRTQT
jgi:hypothetical protein